jgi:hypothetical protein
VWEPAIEVLESADDAGTLDLLLSMPAATDTPRLLEQVLADTRVVGEETILVSVVQAVARNAIGRK